MSEPFRRVDDRIIVDIPLTLREWLAAMAHKTAGDAVDISTSTHHRLLGPIDPTLDHDDPLMQLHRQMTVEGSLGRFITTHTHESLSEDDAEEWIRAFQLMLAAFSAERAIMTAEDRDNLSQQDHYDLITLQSGVSLMIEALDS
jgi:hypothetical protein